MRQRKYWRSADNEQLRHDSVSPSQQGTEDEKARLSGISNLFKFEISAKTSPVFRQVLPQKGKGLEVNQGETRERDRGGTRKVLTGRVMEVTLRLH